MNRQQLTRKANKFRAMALELVHVDAPSLGDVDASLYELAWEAHNGLCKLYKAIEKRAEEQRP